MWLVLVYHDENMLKTYPNVLRGRKCITRVMKKGEERNWDSKVSRKYPLSQCSKYKPVNAEAEIHSFTFH